MAQASISTVLLYTAVVVLAASFIVPLWWNFDPLIKILHDLNFSKIVGRTSKTDNLLTKQELSQYAATISNDKIYLGILGKVFDVSGGKKHYGKDGSYSFFTGIDGTRAFVSGEFNKVGLIDDIEGLKDEECLSLSEWAKFYEDEYKYIGKVIGNFYDENGDDTAALTEFNVKVKRALEAKQNDKKLKDIFPDCNSRWSEKEGTVLWCGVESGGVKRDWAGVPRKFFTPGQSEYRCACVNDKNLNDKRLKEYPGCGVTSASCEIK